MAKKSMYLVWVGRKTGVFYTWNECEEQVKGYKGAKFKGFGSESEMREFMEENNIDIKFGEITQPVEKVKPVKSSNKSNKKSNFRTEASCFPPIERTYASQQKVVGEIFDEVFEDDCLWD